MTQTFSVNVERQIVQFLQAKVTDPNCSIFLRSLGITDPDPGPVPVPCPEPDSVLD
jgi:hypothetical protein